jgi:hypothetical protein
MSRKKRIESGKMSNNFFGLEWKRCANWKIAECESHFITSAEMIF